MDEYKNVGGDFSTNAHRFDNYPFVFLWVLFSGKEILNRKRLFIPNSSTHLIMAMIYLILGILGVHAFTINNNIALLLVSLLSLVAGSRYMITTNIHMMSHGVFFKNRKLDFLLGELLTTVFFVQSCQYYRMDHLKHHGKHFGSLKDGDAQRVIDLGFDPGKSKTQLWVHLLLLCISPVFHYQSLKSRFLDNFSHCTNVRKLMSVLWILVLCSVAVYAGFWLMFWTYIVPVLLLCQVAALLQLICEHIWIPTTLTSKQSHIQLTNGRYCGTPFPEVNSSVGLFVFDCFLWILRNFLIELPVRIAVFQGTVPSHDWHHRFCGSKQWADSAMQREIHIHKQITETGKSSYTEIWGTIEIIDNVFSHISQSDSYAEKSYELG
jgi:fatty acid desaturase